MLFALPLSSLVSDSFLKTSRLTFGGRLGLAGAGPRAKLLGRGFFFGAEGSSASVRVEGFFKLGFLLAGGLGGGIELETF